MALQFEEVNREGVPQKIGIMGPAGAGKTMGAIKLAIGMASATDKVYVIDTENRRAKSYDYLTKGDGKKFRHLGLTGPYSPAIYMEAFNLAVEKGAEVVVIDSLSHVWEAEGGILNTKEMMDAKNSSNTFTNWSAAKRPLGLLIRKILNSEIDVVISIRSKMDYGQEFDDTKKRNVVKSHGLQPVMQPGFEYELMTLLYVDDSHIPTVRKDLTGTLYSIMEPIDYKHGEAIREWKAGGDPPQQASEDSDSEPQEPQPGSKPKEMAKPAECERLAQAYFELGYQVDWDTEVGLYQDDYLARKAGIMEEYKAHLLKKKADQDASIAAKAAE